MFNNGRLHLHCTAFIADIYRETTDIEITEDVPRIASITGESPPYDHRKYPSTSPRYSLYPVVTSGSLLVARKDNSRPARKIILLYFSSVDVRIYYFHF